MSEESKISVNAQTIAAAISVAMGLVKSGLEIYEMIEAKGNLTKEDYLAIIERENKEQAQAKEKLILLLQRL